MKKKERVEILLEDMNSKFVLVLEGHESLREEIRRSRQECRERSDVLESQIGALNQKIDTVSENLNRKIDTVNENLSRKIDAVEARLSARIDTVEGSLSSKIDAVAADLKAHRADTEVHRTPYRVSEPS